MKRSILVSIALAIAAPLLAAPAPPPARGAVAVYLIAAPTTVAGDDLAAAEKRYASASAELDRIKKEWESTLGKKHEQWPADKQAAFLVAVDAANTTAMDVACANTSAKDAEDSVADIKKHLAGKSNVALVDSRGAADLVVEVLGRTGASKLMRGTKAICLDFAPGAKAKHEGLAADSAAWEKQLDQAETVDHHFRADVPFVRVRATTTERWTDAAFKAAYAITSYAKAYYDSLRP